MSITIIGLGRQRPAADFNARFRDVAVIARNRALATRWLDDVAPLHASVEDVFDGSTPDRICSEVVRRIEEALARFDRCVYLVPESAALGDATVEAIVSRYPAEVVPGAFDIGGVLGIVQIVDALELAIAESRAPFDAGLAGVDPTRPLVITNLAGSAVRPMAERRLGRIYGEWDGDRSAAGTVVARPASEPGVVSSFEGLERIVAYLRSPDGCPWDREQTPSTLLPMMLEEVEELRDALASGSGAEQADELGDVLLHLMMIAQIGRESGSFTREDVVRAISAKMVRRHPHVFGDVEFDSIEDLYRIWQDVKDAERAEKASASSSTREG